MTPHAVHDRERLAQLLQRDPHLHAYSLGDLDDFFWPYTTWYERDEQVILVYHGGGFPTVLAFDRDTAALKDFIESTLFLLPQRFYAHISTGASPWPGGEAHLKMALTRPADTPALGEPLTRADLDELTALYEAAYPGNWFDPRMLDTGQYMGVRRDGRLIAVAGVHVWSPVYRVCALGNVTTHPDFRGMGFGRAVVAALCHRLHATVDHITLNVKADNHSAIAVYRSLGFTEVGHYDEMWVRLSGS